MKTVHKFLGAVIILVGLVMMLISALIPSSYQYAKDFLSNAGSATLAIGVVETLYKNFLQEELIERVIVKLQKAISLPVESVYLRRREVPANKDINKVWDLVQDTIYIKAATYSTAVRQGLSVYIDEALKNNSKLKIKFLIFDPDSKMAESYAEFTKRSLNDLKQDVKNFTDQLDQLKKTYPQQLHYALYDAFPTCNIWIVDPETPKGWARISPLISEFKPTHESIVIFITRYQDQKYYDGLYKGIKQLWDDANNPSQTNNP